MGDHFEGGIVRTRFVRKMITLLFLCLGSVSTSGCVLGYVAMVGEHSAAVSAAQGDVDPKSPIFLEACAKDAGIKIYDVAKDVAGYAALSSLIINEDGSPQAELSFDYDALACVSCSYFLQSPWEFKEVFLQAPVEPPSATTSALSKPKELAQGLGWTRYMRVKRPSPLCKRFDDLGGRSLVRGHDDECVAAMSLTEPTARYEVQRSFQQDYARVPYRDGSIGGARVSRTTQRIRDRVTGKVMAEAVEYGFGETVKVWSILALEDPKYGTYSTGYGSCGTASLKIEDVLVPVRRDKSLVKKAGQSSGANLRSSFFQPIAVRASGMASNAAD